MPPPLGHNDEGHGNVIQLLQAEHRRQDAQVAAQRAELQEQRARHDAQVAILQTELHEQRVRYDGYVATLKTELHEQRVRYDAHVASLQAELRPLQQRNDDMFQEMVAVRKQHGDIVYRLTTFLDAAKLPH